MKVGWSYEEYDGNIDSGTGGQPERHDVSGLDPFGE